MRYRTLAACVVAAFVHLSAAELHAFSGPFDGRNLKGRIAFSHDGNFNDEDDWAAFPVAAAILDAFGMTEKLVHFDYCNILTRNDPRFYREMTESVLGASDRYNIPRSILFDCQKDLDGAVESIKNAINASSAEDPLYYVLSGPMAVPALGIEKSDPEKRKYVYCISHSEWNDGFTRSYEAQVLHTNNKRDLIPSGINWVGCQGGGKELSHPGGHGQKSTPEQWRLYHWLRDSGDHDLSWIFTRLEAMGRGDFCDATSTYFLLTGDENTNLAKMKNLLDGKKLPGLLDPRPYVRIEAEDFLILDNYQVEYRIDRSASRRLSIRLASMAPGCICTTFNQPYTLDRGRYDVDVRYFDEDYGRSEMTLYVNGARQGASWRASNNDEIWRIHTIQDVTVSTGDEIKVVGHGDTGEYCKLDYVQFNCKAPSY